MNPSSQIESIQQSQPYTIIQSLHQQQQDQTNNNHISDQQQSSQSSSTNTSVSPSRERERESRHHSHHHHSHNHNHSHNNHNHNHKHHGGTNGSSSHSSSQQNGGHRNDAERMRKKFRDAIYVGNFERVARIIKNIIENDTLDLSSVLLPYASRHVTPIGLAARRGHVKICKVLVEVIKEYVIKQHAAQQQYDDTGLEQGTSIGMDMVNVSAPMLEMLLPTHKAKASRDDKKEKEKSEEDDAEDDGQNEVEDNAALNEGDESSSEQHNNNNASISPQPTNNKNEQQIVSLAINNDKLNVVTANQVENDEDNEADDDEEEDEDEDDVEHDGDHENREQSKEESASKLNNYIFDPAKKTKKKKKGKHSIVRSSSSGALMDEKQQLQLEQHSKNGSKAKLKMKDKNKIDLENDKLKQKNKIIELKRLKQENEEKIDEMELSISPQINNNIERKHRKTRSLPYIHLHSMLNRLDGENRTALSHACEKGQREVIEFLLSEPGIAIEAGGKHHEESWTNLHWACRYGHHEIVQLLLDHNANINAQTSKKKSTGLHLACATGHTEVIHVLLKNGAAKEIEDVYGCSPLSLAIHFGEKKVQQILYEAGIDVSPHDARRLKKDNHIFRRFGWIKIPPSISTKVVLPDDVWCVVCGFLPCDELLLNVRLVSFGFLYVVHHPALRKLVNFKRCLPDKADELVNYNENHQTLVLKAPSPENNFNNAGAPFNFMAPPPAAAILGGAPPHPLHPHAPHVPPPHHGHHHHGGAPPHPHGHGHVHGHPPPHPLHGHPHPHPHLTRHAPNPFGGPFPHFMIPHAPHNPHNPAHTHPHPAHTHPLHHLTHHAPATSNNTTTTHSNSHSPTNGTQQLQSSLPPPPPPPTLQSIYNNNSNNNNDSQSHRQHINRHFTTSNPLTRPQSNSLPTRVGPHSNPLLNGSRPSNEHHQLYLSQDASNDHDNDNEEDDEFTPPPIQSNLQRTASNPIHNSHNPMLTNFVEELKRNDTDNNVNQNLNTNNNNNNNNTTDQQSISPLSRHNVSNIIATQLRQSSSDLANIPTPFDDENKEPQLQPQQSTGSRDSNDGNQSADSQSQSMSISRRQLLDMNGQIASLIFDHVAPQNISNQVQNTVTNETEQKQQSLNISAPQRAPPIQRQQSNDTPIPSDIGMFSNLAQQSSDSIILNQQQNNALFPDTGGNNDRPSPILTSAQPINQTLAATINNHRNRINLQTIDSNATQQPTNNGLPQQGSNGASPTFFHGPNGSLSFGNLNSPPLLSRNYSHNNINFQQQQDFQRLLSLSPPMSPSLTNQNNNNNNITINGINANQIPSPTNLPNSQFIEFRQPPPHDISIPLNNGNDDINGNNNNNNTNNTNNNNDNNSNDDLLLMNDNQNQGIFGSRVLNISPWSSTNDMMAINNPMLNNAPIDNMFFAPPNGNNDNDDNNDNDSNNDDNIIPPHLSQHHHHHHHPHHPHHHMPPQHLHNHFNINITNQNDDSALMASLSQHIEDAERKEHDSSDEEKKEDKTNTWQYKHCRWLACAVNFGPSNLRKIRLTGVSILTQPLIRVLSCLSFIVHLELAHFHAYKLTTMNLQHLSRVSQLKMIRQLKVFPVIRNNNYRSAMYDACAVATFITQIGSTALTLGIKYETIEIDPKEEEEIQKAMSKFEQQIKQENEQKKKEADKRAKEKEEKEENEEDEDNDDDEEETVIEEEVFDIDSSTIDMAQLSSLTWKSLFDHLPSNLRSLRLHFGKDDSLKSGAVHGLKNFESIKCFTLHGDPGLYGQIKEWSNVFQRWNKLRYIVLGHRNNTKELQVPKEILQALPPMLPELALNISVHSIPNVVWYLKHVVKAECFLRINLHVVHKHKSDLYHASIHNEIIPCLTRFHNLETAYLKCGMVTLQQIELLLQNCTKVSFVGFGIDASDEKQVVSFRILLEDYGFDKIVVKTKLNWLIAVKSYDKLLLDPTRCIHPVLEAFDDKSCQIMSPIKMKPKPKMIMPINTHIQPL